MKLVCIAPHIPHEGIDHAGGEYLLRYLEVVHALGHVVTVVVPDTPATAAASGRQPDWLSVIRGPRDRAGLLVRAWRLIRHGASSLPPRAFDARLPATARAAIGEADVIDLQWMSSVQHASNVRRWNTRAAIVATPHDVYSESVHRAGTSTSLARRTVARVALRAVRRTERSELSACDRVFVFKAGDVHTLARLGIRTDVRTTPPVVELPEQAIKPVASGLLVFTAAFWRDENDEAARWFLAEVLPLVHRTHPATRVRFAGARPSAWLEAQAGPLIEVTGYLPDLLDAYRGAQIAIAPLQRGAGLKFKVVQALALGFPVVATPVGAEGVNELADAQVLTAASDATTFAAAVIAALEGWPQARDAAQETAALLARRLDFRGQVAEQVGQYDELRRGR